MKRSALLLMSLVASVGLLAGVMLLGGLPQSSQSHTSLSGFDPGATVSYRVSTSEEDLLTGSDVVDGQGRLIIPAYTSDKNKKHSALTYDINIERAGGPLDVRFYIKPETGEAVVSAEGLEQFSEITLEKITGNEVTGALKTKADWAGVFRDNIGISSNKGESLKLALFSNMANDGQMQSPYVIQVQSCCTACSNCQQDLERNYIAAMAGMAEQFSVVMMYQAEVISTFFDAKQHLETEQEFQKLTARAHKDYHPSDQMCRFGTFVRTVAKTEQKAAHDKAALNSTLMSAYTGLQHGTTSEGYASDIRSRLDQFRKVYCDPKDNNSGLNYMCEHSGGSVGAVDKARMNKDIDFGRTLNNPFTLEVNFTDSTLEDDEEDVLALAKNLYWPVAFAHASDEAFDRRNYIRHSDIKYMNARQLLAMQNVAHNSFTDIVSMKAKTIAAAADPNGPSFMKALLVDFGLSAADIDVLVGEFPSYYAQMEVLTKKIYQDPDFYTNLYDKPANLDRISASMEAIKLMQGRDHYEASLRREMLTSLMIEESLQLYHEFIDPQITREIRSLPQ